MQKIPKQFFFFITHHKSNRQSNNRIFGQLLYIYFIYTLHLVKSFLYYKAQNAKKKTHASAKKSFQPEYKETSVLDLFLSKAKNVVYFCVYIAWCLYEIRNIFAIQCGLDENAFYELNHNFYDSTKFDSTTFHLTNNKCVFRRKFSCYIVFEFWGFFSL